jgi:predicted DNA-binding transcriptional regulator AlpA
VVSQQELSTKSVHWPTFSDRLGRLRPRTAGLAHLVFMKTTTSSETAFSRVVTLSQLATQLGVTVQTLYDLRSQGRGPRGFRVGPGAPLPGQRGRFMARPDGSR